MVDFTREHHKIFLKHGDISKFEVDAIVNDADPSLEGGNGMDGIIHRNGGPDILMDCLRSRRANGECGISKAVLTTAGTLPSKKIIHVVSPKWEGGEANEESLLKEAYFNCLNLAVKNKLRTIAFPALGAAHSFPHDKSAEIALNSVYEFLKINGKSIDEVTFVCFAAGTYRSFHRVLENLKERAELL